MFSAKVLIICAVAAVAYGGPMKYKLSAKHLGLIGGVTASSGQFTFFAAIIHCISTNNCHSICGGVILNENWILSGAFCAENAAQIYVGFEDWNTEQLIDVEKIIKHPDYDNSDEGVGPNDIGLIKLRTPLTYNLNVQPAILPAQNQTPIGKADVSGISNVGAGYPFLQYAANRTLVSYQDCKAAFESIFPGVVSPLDEVSNICTLDDNSNVCQEDHGNPLSQGNIVIGLATWAILPCGYEGAPNFFTNVAQFADWVNKTVASN